MKTLNIFFLLLVIGLANANGQQVFSNVSLDKYRAHDAISFVVPSEANVFQYRVLAGNDSTRLTIIGVVKPTGNSVLAKSYHFDINELGYAYYRVVEVGMDSKLKYSPVIPAKQPEVKQAPYMDIHNNNTGSAIVTSH